MKRAAIIVGSFALLAACVNDFDALSSGPQTKDAKDSGTAPNGDDDDAIGASDDDPSTTCGAPVTCKPESHSSDFGGTVTNTCNGCGCSCPSQTCPSTDGLDECTTTCTAGSICGGTCSNSSSCAFAVDKSVGKFTCTDAACALECTSGALCNFDCRGADSCTVGCHDTSQCAVTCDDGKKCSVTCADNSPAKSCGKGVFVCNEACP